MVIFSKETRKFLEILESDASRSLQKVMAPIPASASRFVPGDVLIFRYYVGAGKGSRSQKTILIVYTRRGDGVFMSTKNNLLVTCFKLTGAQARSDVIIGAIVDNLYKKRRKASYYGLIKESLKSLLGVNNFRTYKIERMRGIYKLNLGYDLGR